tara:strand:- start:1403 stop:1669 length:267 start_codon:yes stop_codon:yes gene_type:complete
VLFFPITDERNNNTLSLLSLSLSLFSLKTLLSIEGTENNREDVSAARDDACAFLCKQKREKNEVRALKMKTTRATESKKCLFLRGKLW